MYPGEIIDEQELKNRMDREDKDRFVFQYNGAL
jgi:hypothetical protein